MVQLTELLQLTQTDTDIYTGITPTTTIQRVFGGQVAAQTLMAAMLTVPEDRIVHSVHANFLQPGDPHAPMTFKVERTRDGGSFSSRRVATKQHGKKIFTLAASFHVHEDGPDHQSAIPNVPPPNEVESVIADMQKRGVPWVLDVFPGYESIDYRLIEPLDKLASERSHNLQAWFKSKETLPDDPRIHTGALTFMSDLALIFPAILPHMPSLDTRYQVASLDHAIWFHRPFKADEWLLYNINSCSASGARGIARGHIFSQDGTMVATAIQEGLMRPISHDPPSGS